MLLLMDFHICRKVTSELRTDQLCYDPLCGLCAGI